MINLYECQVHKDPAKTGGNNVAFPMPISKKILKASSTATSAVAESARMDWFANRQFPLYLAPMAGFTDLPFRHLCKREGADVMVSEFVMCEALVRGVERVWQTIEFTDFQRPMGVQLFGAEPQQMARAARMVADRLAPDFIDLNFGCPSEKVTRQSAGCSLLRELPRLFEIAAAVRQAVPERPVTAKIRLGWDSDSIVAVEAALGLEAVGIEALVIHGRTRVQGYRGDANLAPIIEAAQQVSIPVVANGCGASVETLRYLRDETPCAGAMIGRAALGNPWIFRQLKAALAGGLSEIPSPTASDRWQTLLFYARELAASPAGQKRANELGWMRAKLKSLTKGLPDGRNLRAALDQLQTLAELESYPGPSEP